MKHSIRLALLLRYRGQKSCRRPGTIGLVLPRVTTGVREAREARLQVNLCTRLDLSGRKLLQLHALLPF